MAHESFTIADHDTPDRHPNSVIKTASGEVTADVGGGEYADIVMSEYCFFPNMFGYQHNFVLYTYPTSTAGTVGRFAVKNVDSAQHTCKIVWRYITASDNPQIWVVQHPITGEIIGIWEADDPPEIETDNPFKIIPIQHYDKNGKPYGITNYIEIPSFLDEFRATLREGELAEVKKRYKLREKSTRPKLLPEHIRFCKLEKV